MGSFENRVRKSVEASIAAKQRFLEDAKLLAVIGDVVGVLIQAFKAGNKVLLFGNGGSAADAQHIAAEFVGRFAFDRPALPALSLSVNPSCVTAIGNDYGFDLVFSRQLEALARHGDVAIGITTSGQSPNVLHGLATAQKMGLRTVGMTGSKKDKIAELVEHCISVPASETPRIQESHILVGHIISQLVEEEIFHD
jgi:D-sedoheptulose 7-phosphate isomerase